MGRESKREMNFWITIKFSLRSFKRTRNQKRTEWLPFLILRKTKIKMKGSLPKKKKKKAKEKEKAGKLKR